MAESFRGTLRVRHLQAMDVTLTVSDAMVEIEAPGEPLGTWPIEECAIAPSGQGTFRITVGGEDALFDPQDASRFAAVASTAFRSSPLADRREVLRSSGSSPAAVPREDPPGVESIPEHSPEETASPAGDLLARLRPYRYAAFVASALLAGALAAALGFGPAGEPPPTLAGTGESLPAPPSTAPDAFSLTPRAFADRWNQVADDFGVDLRLIGVAGSGPFEVRPAEHILVQGEVGADGTVDGVVVTSDPTVGQEDRRLVVAAWGVLIAVSDPTLGPEERADVLENLGVDVDQPRLHGGQATVRSGGLRYSISYLEGLDAVLFSVDEA
jgi:hypothetical protein